MHIWRANYHNMVCMWRPQYPTHAPRLALAMRDKNAHIVVSVQGRSTITQQTYVCKLGQTNNVTCAVQKLVRDTHTQACKDTISLNNWVPCPWLVDLTTSLQTQPPDFLNVIYQSYDCVWRSPLQLLYKNRDTHTHTCWQTRTWRRVRGGLDFTQHITIPYQTTVCIRTLY